MCLVIIKKQHAHMHWSGTRFGTRSWEHEAVFLSSLARQRQGWWGGAGLARRAARRKGELTKPVNTLVAAHGLNSLARTLLLAMLPPGDGSECSMET